MKRYVYFQPNDKDLKDKVDCVVACVDGKYFDTWDSGYKSLYGYYQLKEK